MIWQQSSISSHNLTLEKVCLISYRLLLLVPIDEQCLWLRSPQCDSHQDV